MQLHKNIIDGHRPPSAAAATATSASKGKQKKIKPAPLSKIPNPFLKKGDVNIKDVTGKNSTFPLHKTAFEIKLYARPQSQRQRGKNPAPGGRFFDGSAVEKRRLRSRLDEAIKRMETKPLKTGAPMQVQMFFYFRIPLSNPGKKIKVHDFYDKVPDIDNLQKFVFDALKGLFYQDDKQIVYVEACKQYDLYDHTDILIGEWGPKQK